MKYRLILDFNARIDWIEAPEDRAEQSARDSLNLRLKEQIKVFELKLERAINVELAEKPQTRG